MNDIKEIAVKLYGLCAAGGCEREMSECISEYLKDIESFKDAHGTIVFHKKGTGTPAVILTALDIPSLFTTHRDKDGFMRFCTYGVDHKKIKGARVRFERGKYGTVFSEKDKDDMTDFFIDTGGENIGEAEPVSIDTGLYFAGDTVRGFSAADYLLKSVLISAACAKTTRDCYFVFAAKTALPRFSAGFMHKIPRECEIYVLDKSEVHDVPGNDNVQTKLGGGVCLRVADKSVISSKRLVSKTEVIAKNIKIQREVSGRTGLGSSLQSYELGYELVSLGLPARYADELCETASLSDAEELQKLLIKYLEV